jgi:hypothetical protein
MKNRHALIDPKTGLVRNIIIWEGAPFLPPQDHYVVHNCDGQIGDYWHQDSNAFYTINGKRRFRDERGKVGESELNNHEKEHIEPRLKKIYAHAFKKYRWEHSLDLTREDVEVPKMLEEVVNK